MWREERRQKDRCYKTIYYYTKASFFVHETEVWVTTCNVGSRKDGKKIKLYFKLRYNKERGVTR